MEDIIDTHINVLKSISDKSKVDEHILILSGKPRKDIYSVRRSDVGYLLVAMDYSQKRVAKYFDKKKSELKQKYRLLNNQGDILREAGIECDDVMKLERGTMDECFNLDDKFDQYLALINQAKQVIEYSIGGREIGVMLSSMHGKY